MIDDVLFEFLHMEAVNVLCSPLPLAGDHAVDVTRLESVGYHTGYRFVERQTKDWQRFKDELDILKFVCKEFWSAVFKKQIDNLRTNHQGVYVLLDNRFKFVTRISASKQYLDMIPRYLAFACGMVRGALANLGLNSVVTAEVVVPPSCKFQIQIQKPQMPQPQVVNTT